MKVTLAFDGSAAAEAALQMLRTLVCPEDEVTVYQCIEKPGFFTCASEPIPVANAVSRAEAECQDVAEQLQQAGFKSVNVTTRIADDVEEDLMDVCEDSDMLVMGTKDKTVWDRAFNGSTSTYALTHFNGSGKVLCIAHALPECTGHPDIPPQSQRDSTLSARDSGQSQCTASSVGYSSGLMHHKHPHLEHLETRNAGHEYLVFFDGSASAADAARFVAGRMRPVDSACLICIFEPFDGYSGLQNPALYAALTKDLRIQECRQILDNGIAIMKKECCPEAAANLSTKVVQVMAGNEGLGILAMTKQARAGEKELCGHVSQTIAVVGSSQRGPWMQNLAGSPGLKLLHGCDVPLIVVHSTKAL
jgi:nucleotide-binding universal stress UspA family protein